MKFDEFQSHCKYTHWGIKEDSCSVFELTCRRPDRVPKNCSWGKCDVIHCPHFGLKFEGGTMIDQTTGKVIMTFGAGSVLFSNEEDRKERK